MKDKIARGADVAKRDGKENYKNWIIEASDKLQKRNVIDKCWTGEISGDPIQARIDYGRWLADCECGGAEYVDPNEPLFFCLSCGNESNNHDARPVIFPSDIDEIEAALLEREVKNHVGMIGRPKGSLVRNWSPGETLDDLKDENKKGKHK